jgi:hypothetical protein
MMCVMCVVDMKHKGVLEVIFRRWKTETCQKQSRIPAAFTSSYQPR